MRHRYDWICRILILAGVLLAAGGVSARAWRVEKDGSGDFTVIQDAIDAAASGDSVLVGAGRFDDFRQQTYQPSGPQIMAVMYVAKPDLILCGAGSQWTTIGPDSLVSEIGGMNPAGILIEPGSVVEVSGFTFENTRFPVNIRYRSRVEMCRVINSGDNWALTIIEGDSVTVRACEFVGPSAIITSSSSVTNPQVLDCNFENLALDETAIVIGNGAIGALVARCAITGYAGGVEASLGGSVTIEDTQFHQIRIDAIDLSSGSIVMRRCRIDEGNRFPIRSGQGTLEIYDSVIGGGTLTTIAAADGVYARNCHILNAGGWTVDAIGTAIQVSDLRENWWGTTDLAQIAAWINQPNNNVLYEPILPAPVSIQAESIGGFKALFGGGGGD